MISSNFINDFQRLYPLIKRVIDVCAALILMIVFLPFFTAIIIAVKITSSGPAIFWSDRIGQDGRVFSMPKFRSMTVTSKIMSRESATDADITVTRVGAFLRKSSLDELPQLWSVFCGDMSFIGPRPLLIHDIARGQRSKRPNIYSVKPGITGLAQVSGRNFLSAKDKCRYDIFYAQRLCMFLDALILVKTVKTVFSPRFIR